MRLDHGPRALFKRDLCPRAFLPGALIASLFFVLPMGGGITFAFWEGYRLYHFSIQEAIPTLVPVLSQSEIAGLSQVTEQSSAAVTTLEHSFSNSMSSVDWAAIAGAVGIASASSDGAFALFTAMPNNVGNAAMLDLAVSLIIEMIAFVVSIVVWASHHGVVAIIGPLFGLLGFGAAYVAYGRSQPATSVYAQSSLVLAGIGLAGTSADVLASET